MREFQKQGVSINLETTKFPTNAFSSEPYQLKLSLTDIEYWSIHLVDRQLEKIGLIFVRVEKRPSGQEVLTNDSIVFRWVGSDRYGFSLHDRITPEIRTNVFAGLDSSIRPISNAEADLKNLLINLIKYVIARDNAKKT